jgi:hypothetical protein
MSLDLSATFERARQSTRLALQNLVEEAKRYATEDNETRWELTLDARELIEPLLADFCQEWFGLSEQGACFRRAGYRWDWKPGEPPNYPGHFLSPSRYIFQPHPGPEVEKIGAAHGAAVRSAMVDFLGRFGATIGAPVTRAVLDFDPGKTDTAFAARTVAGAMMGFIPTVDGNLRRILNEWLREGVLWSLRGRYAGSPAADFTEACNRLGGDFIPAMLLRAVPELIWRTATVAHSLGEEPHQIAVNPGEVIVAGAVSATQQTLVEGGNYLYHAFGGNRRVQGHPTHACPGADPALALMLGFFSALVESELPLRAGPGPLTLALDGQLPPSPAVPHPDALFALGLAFPIAPVAATPIAVIGDSWLSLLQWSGLHWPSLLSQLGPLGFGTGPGMAFADAGRLLKEMAAPQNIQKAKSYFLNLGPGDPKPKALLIGGGGNDVTYPSSQPTQTRLYQMLVALPAPGPDYLIDTQVTQFIDGELFGYYKVIIDELKDVTDIPIVIHGYDHPIPDGRGFLFWPPWLQPVFKARGYDFTNAADTALARDIMRQLIDRVNLMIENVSAAYPGRVRHVKLTGILAAKYGAPDNYKSLWLNELHANEEGFNQLAAEIAANL